MAKSKKPKSTSPPPKSLSPTEPSSSSSSPQASQQDEGIQSPEKAKTAPPQESFESYYLRRVTSAFADDIDKVRAAPDFTSKSIPILIQALKQGAYSFTPEEQERIMSTANRQPEDKNVE